MTDGTPIPGKPAADAFDGSEEFPLVQGGAGKFGTLDQVAAFVGGGSWIYGDGSDGDLVLHDGDLWMPGYYHDVTIEARATVRINPFATVWPTFRCTGTFTILGTLDLSGNGAVDFNGAPGQVVGSGGSGGQTDGEPSQSQFSGLVTAGGVPLGGAGGDGAAGSGAARAQPVYPFQALGPRSGRVPESIPNVPLSGSGGGGDGTNYGGGGGSAGYWAQIFARHVIHGPDNAYNLQGGNGAPGGDDGTGATGNGNCGGGGGGGAGYWVTLSDTVDAQPALLPGHVPFVNGVGIGTGGIGGAGSGTGSDGSSGDDGFVIHLLNR